MGLDDDVGSIQAAAVKYRLIHIQLFFQHFAINNHTYQAISVKAQGRFVGCNHLNSALGRLDHTSRKVFQTAANQRNTAVICSNRSTILYFSRCIYVASDQLEASIRILSAHGTIERRDRQGGDINYCPLRKNNAPRINKHHVAVGFKGTIYLAYCTLHSVNNNPGRIRLA